MGNPEELSIGPTDEQRLAWTSPNGTLDKVDALELNDIQLAQQSEPGEKLVQALELMAVGFRLKLAVLRDRRPGASDAEIKTEFEHWLIADG